MPGASPRLSPTVSPRLSPRLSLAALDSIVLGDELWRSIERLDGRTDDEEGCDDEGRGAQEGCGAQEGIGPLPSAVGPLHERGSTLSASTPPDAAQMPADGIEPIGAATRHVRGASHTVGAAPPLLRARAADGHGRRACALLALPTASSRIPPPPGALKRRADELGRSEGARNSLVVTPPAYRSSGGAGATRTPATYRIAGGGADWRDPAAHRGGGRVRPGPPSPLLLPPLALPSSPPALTAPSPSFSALTLPSPLALPTPSTPFSSDRTPRTATAPVRHRSPAHPPANPSRARCPATAALPPWRTQGAERPDGGALGGTAVEGGVTVGVGAAVGAGAAVAGRAAVGIRKIVGAHTVALGLRGGGKADAAPPMEITAGAAAAVVVTPAASAALVGATSTRTAPDATAIAAEGEIATERDTAAAAAAAATATPEARAESAEPAKAAGGVGSAAGEGQAGGKRRKVGGGARVCMSAEAAAALEEYREKAAQRQRRGTAMDAQSVAARRRRANISSRMGVLKSLVPGSARLDTASLLERAAAYIAFPNPCLTFPAIPPPPLPPVPSNVSHQSLVPGSARLDTASLLERAAAYIAFLHDHSLAAGAGHADMLQARFTHGLGAVDEGVEGGGGSDGCADAAGVGAAGGAAGGGAGAGCGGDAGASADDMECMDS
ncbi:unnamed protein product [Closterium sp. Naga37s-1]|nr:unnamed protein product [Closterium sp. Naga37s-1]